MRRALLAVTLLVAAACGPPDGERRELRRTWDDGSVRTLGQEVVQDGEWVKDGPFVFYGPDGEKVAEGAYAGGLETGAWTRWLEDGTRTEGRFENGEREGLWTFWHEEGTRQEEGHYANGVRVGRWTLWYPSGAVREENDYVDGAMHGQRRAYREDGSLDPGRSGVFENGERVGPLPR